MHVMISVYVWIVVWQAFVEEGGRRVQPSALFKTLLYNLPHTPLRNTQPHSLIPSIHPIHLHSTNHSYSYSHSHSHLVSSSIPALQRRSSLPLSHRTNWGPGTAFFSLFARYLVIAQLGSLLISSITLPL